MSDEVSAVDIRNIELAERYFDMWGRDEAWFFGFMTRHPTTLFLAGSFIYSTLVQTMGMKKMEHRSPEELADLEAESAPWVQGCDRLTVKLVKQLIAVLIHIGELRSLKQPQHEGY